MHIPAGHLEFDASIGRWSVRCKFCGLRLDRAPKPRAVMKLLLDELGWVESPFWGWKGWNCPKCVEREEIKGEE